METNASSSLGIFTTDEALCVRTWDDWMAATTGISATSAAGKPIGELIPDLEERGLLEKLTQVLEKGTIVVLAPLFHRYLIPCPPVTPSTRFKHMRQRVTLMPLRDGAMIKGVMVSVEDATPRMESEAEKRVSQTDAPSPASDAEPLIQALGDTDWRVRKEAVSGLIQYGDPRSTAALLQTLQTEHSDLGALNSALEVLTLSRIDVIPPLLELLEKGDTDLRLYVAQLLGDKGDDRAVSPLIEALGDDDANIRYHAVEALGKLRAAEAVEPLLEIVESGDFYLSFPAIDALSQIGDPRAAPRLVPLLENDLLMSPASELLGKLGDEEVVPHLVSLLKSPGPHATIVARALSSLYDRYETLYGEGEHIADLTANHMAPAGLQNLMETLSDADETAIRPLAMVLGWLRGPGVEKSLTRLMGHPEARGEVIEALVRHGGSVTKLLTEQLSSEDLEIRFAAVIALGRIGDARAVPFLVKTLSHDKELTVVAAGALAKIGDRDAYGSLLELLGHKGTVVRQAAISALNSLGHPRMPEDMNRLMSDPDPNVRESAVKISGYFGYAECLEAFLERAEDPHEAVRRAVIEHLPYLEDDAADEKLLMAFKKDSPRVRAAAAKAMAHLDRNKARAPLLSALSDTDQWVRFFAVRSISRHGYREAGDRILSLGKTDPAPQVRIAAMGAAARIGGEDAVSFLAEQVNDADLNIARSAIEALGEVGPPHAVSGLLPALRAKDPALTVAAIRALGSWNTDDAAEMLQWMAASGKTGEVRESAMAALQRMGTPRAVSALVQMTATPSLHDMAVAALSGLGEGCIDLLTAHLTHPHPQVKKAVIDVMTRIKHPKASAALMSALKDPDARVRASAVRSLAKLGNRSARESILKMVRQDPDIMVKREAQKALEKL